MTVAELKELLKEFNDDATVLIIADGNHPTIRNYIAPDVRSGIAVYDKEYHQWSEYAGDAYLSEYGVKANVVIFS